MRAATSVLRRVALLLNVARKTKKKNTCQTLLYPVRSTPVCVVIVARNAPKRHQTSWGRLNLREPINGRLELRSRTVVFGRIIR